MSTTHEHQRILIVGAGAVGQVYALHLQRGGARVGLFVKPRYLQACAAGLTLYPLSGRERGQRVVLSGCDVFSEIKEVAAQQFDQVWLCVSSTGLRGPWLDAFLGAVGEATVVMLQPGPADRAYLLARCKAEQLVVGLITLISYQTPLATEQRDVPGVAYFLPPLTPNPFSGTPQRVREVVGALRRGGCNAKVVTDAGATGALGAGLFQPMVAGLELCNWSFAKLGRSDKRVLIAAAMREAAATVQRRAWVNWLARPWLLRVLTMVAPRLLPFDLPTYMEYHFTKVGDQTRVLLQQYIDAAQAKGLGHTALGELLHALPPATHVAAKTFAVA